MPDCCSLASTGSGYGAAMEQVAGLNEEARHAVGNVGKALGAEPICTSARTLLVPTPNHDDATPTQQVEAPLASQQSVPEDEKNIPHCIGHFKIFIIIHIIPPIVSSRHSSRSHHSSSPSPSLPYFDTGY